MEHSILLVEDDELLAENIQTYLERKDFEVTVCHSAEDALAQLETFMPDIVLTDNSLPGMSGHDLIQKLRISAPDLKVIMMTGYGNVEDAVVAMKEGAFHYVTKPVALTELKLLLDKALATERMERTLSFYQEREAQKSGVQALIGDSAPMQYLKNTIGQLLDAERRMANTDLPPVLVEGETGTGKLLLANALAGRMGVPIRTHQCTALSLDNRLNIQQVSDDLANGGAVVFHRIDSLPKVSRDQLTLLLSGLDQPRVFMTFATVTDDMLPLISSMQGIEIQMPSLRIRRDDIPLLVDHFLNALPQPRRVSSRLLEVLAGAEGPGNVRQLKEVVEAAALRATGAEVRLDDLAEVHRRALARIRLSRLQRAELEQIREALIEAGGNRLRAAAILRIGRSTLYRKIDSYTVRGFEIEVRS